MINQPPSNQPPDLPEFTDLLDIDLLDSELLTDEAIELSNEQIDRAVQFSQSIPHSTQQWQTYLHGLALVGFEQWLEEWASDLEVDESNCSIFQPPYANLIDAVCHLRVGRFNLCLIAVSSMINLTIDLPKAIIELPQFLPDIYVLMHVQEEQMQVQLYRYLHRDRLMEYRQSNPLPVDAGWKSAVPLHWFNADPTALLIELRRPDAAYLSSSAEPSPRYAQPPFKTRLHSLLPLLDRLHSLLPQLRSPDYLPSQLLTWEEAATLLSHPEWVNWLYQAQQGEGKPEVKAWGSGRAEAWRHSIPTKIRPLSAASVSCPDLNQQTTDTIPSSSLDPSQQTINVGHWLTDRLDAVAHKLGWILLPPLVPAAALRSAQEELEGLGVKLPPEARGAYEDLQLGQTALRLYAFAWILSSESDLFQWTLLIVLGAQPQSDLPAGIRLQVRDQTQLLCEQILVEVAKDSCLYAQVGGEMSDRFWVTIDLPDGTTLSLPPFIFYPDSEAIES